MYIGTIKAALVKFSSHIKKQTQQEISLNFAAVAAPGWCFCVHRGKLKRAQQPLSEHSRPGTKHSL